MERVASALPDAQPPSPGVPRGDNGAEPLVTTVGSCRSLE